MKFMLCKSLEEKDINKWFDLDLKYYKTEYKANIKYDGERIIAIIKDGEVTLVNRRGNIKNSNFKEVVESLKGLPNCILDGEVITYCDTFNKLLKRSLTKDKFKQQQLQKEIPVKYMVFDILQFKNEWIVDKELKDRLGFLKDIPVLSVEYGEIREVYEKAKEEDREGIIIKSMNSKYEQKRSFDWLKCKFFKETTLSVTKYTTNNAGIRVEDEDGNVVQVSGLQHKAVKEEIDKGGGCKIEVQYLEKTKKERLRNPSFRGIKNGNK